MKVLCLDKSGSSAVFELLDGVRTFVSGDQNLISDSYGVQVMPAQISEEVIIIGHEDQLNPGGIINNMTLLIDKLYSQSLQDILKEYSCLFIDPDDRPVPVYPVQKQKLRRSPPSRNTGNPFKKILRSVNRNR